MTLTELPTGTRAGGPTLQALEALGLRDHPTGATSWTGEALRLRRAIEGALDALAADVPDEVHPGLIDPGVVTASGWLSSFPHLALSAAAIDVEAGEADQIKPVSPVGLLAPAACHSVYHHHTGARLTEPLHAHVRGPVARLEDYVDPLRRQRLFTMDEIVVIGSAAHVEAEVDNRRTSLHESFARWGIEVEWLPATDPFYRELSGPALAQRVRTVKWEATIAGLAIASANHHLAHFGEAFDLRLADDTPADSGCVATGVDRVVWAWLFVHGTDPAAWPELPSAGSPLSEPVPAPRGKERP